MAAVKDRRGRHQRARTATGRARRPNLARYYGRKLKPVDPGEFDFELTLLRGGKAKPIRLDRMVEGFDWSDEEDAMTGSVQLRRPAPGSKRALPIGRGHRVRCRVKWAGRWYTLWTMRVQAPEVTLSTSASVSVPLVDDLAPLRRGRRRYLRRKRKRHPHGYFGHVVLREFARREGVRLGAIAKCKHRMSKIDVTGSLLDLAVAIYRHEHEKTGRRFVIRMRGGKLEVVPYRRNRTLYVLAGQIQEATISQQPKVERPATVLVGRARLGKGEHAKKIRHTEYRRDMVRRFGYVRREHDFGRVDSEGELRAKVRRRLARNYKVETRVTVEHAGIPFIRRGDGAQVVLPSDGFTGRLSYVYCLGGRHTVRGGEYRSSWTFTRVDPFVKDRERREREARERKRRQRERQRQRGS